MWRSTPRASVFVAAVLIVLVSGYWALATPRAEATPWKAYGGRAEVAEDDRTLTLHYVGGACDDRVELEIDESDQRVEVTLLITLERVDACNDVGYPRTITTQLKEPLDDREIVDGSDR